jgi:hypothetical protein
MYIVEEAQAVEAAVRFPVEYPIDPSWHDMA